MVGRSTYAKKDAVTQVQVYNCYYSYTWRVNIDYIRGAGKPPTSTSYWCHIYTSTTSKKTSKDRQTCWLVYTVLTMILLCTYIRVYLLYAMMLLAVHDGKTARAKQRISARQSSGLCIDRAPPIFRVVVFPAFIDRCFLPRTTVYVSCTYATQHT